MWSRVPTAHCGLSPTHDSCNLDPAVVAALGSQIDATMTEPLPTKRRERQCDILILFIL